jgi:hypothetical protein
MALVPAAAPVKAAALVKVWLGQWQLDRARQTFPGWGVDLPVTAAGTWDAAHQLLVADRRDTT